MFGKKNLVFMMAVCVGLTAVIHVLLGLYGVGEWIMTGEVTSVLAPLFLLSGITILIGMGAVYRGLLAPRPAYVLGAGMMGIYLIGYADWHAFGYTETILGLDESHHSHDPGHNHGDHNEHDNAHNHRDTAEPSTLITLFDHFRSDLIAVIAKTVESIAATLLTALAVTTERE